MSGAYDSRADTLAHIHHVRDNIGVFVAEMLRRGRSHDASKLSDVEKPRLDEVLPMLEGVAYGSPAWDDVVNQAADALAHHYRHNTHHPEHYGNDGVAGMDLFDLVEMVCDWMAAARRNPADGKASIVVGVSQDLTGRVNAVDLVRKAAAAVGGKGGGGRPEMAQAGGPEGGKTEQALAAVRAALG